MDKIIEYGSRASIVTLLLAVLVTGQQGMWVWGTTLQTVEKDRDTWKALALKGLEVAEDSRPARVIGDAFPAPMSSTSPEAVRARLETLENKGEALAQ